MRNRAAVALSVLAVNGVLLGSASAQTADPTTEDCIAASERSIDLRAAHKLQAARAQLLVCAAASCPADIRAECLRRVDQVNAGISTIVFEAKDAAGNDLAGVRVTMDGQLLSDRLDGTAISLDPGEHRFVFEAPGRPEVERVIVLHEAEKERRERVVFESLPAPSAPPPAAGDALRTVGIVAGAAGGVGLALGSVFGLMASSSWSSSKAECASPVNCQNHGAAVSDHDTASTDATISTIAFAAGGATLAAGVVLFVTSVTRPQATGVRWQLVPAVGSGGGGIVWKMSL